MVRAITTQFISPIVNPLIKKAAQAYVAGNDLTAAIDACRCLHDQGVGSTVCFWNDGNDSPIEVARQYRATIEALAFHRLQAYASIKATAIDFSRDLASEVFDTAQMHRVPIHFDAMAAPAAEQTFEIVRELLGQVQHFEGKDSAFRRRGQRPSTDATILGCTLPGRWQRSIHDAERLASAPLRIRVVKGQWPDPQNPRMNSRKGYLDIIERLAGRTAAVAVATHDPDLAMESIERLLAKSTPCELELLYGLPVRHVRRVSKLLGVPIRFYIPYGHAWLPYAVKRAIVNPHIAWWVLRDAFASQGSPIEHVR